MIESSRKLEFDLLRAAEAAGVPVPRVRWCGGDDPVLGASFFVMDFVEGETIGRKILRDAALATARSVLPEQLADAAARIHTIDAGPLGLRVSDDAGPSAADGDSLDAGTRSVIVVEGDQVACSRSFDVHVHPPLGGRRGEGACEHLLC